MEAEVNKMTKQPSYRFAGYTEPWAEKKLGEVAEVNPKSVVPDEFKYVDLGAVVGTEMISYRNETIPTSPSRAQRLAIKGDIFYQTVRPYQKNNYLFEKDDNDYVFSTGYAQLRPSGDGCFLLSYLQTNKFVNVVLDNCTGTSYPAINSKDLSDIFISLPSLPEQTAIGSFFQDIDQLISLQQRKLEVLKEQKKTYLKLLFPAKGQTKPALRFAGFEDEWKEVKVSDIFRVTRGQVLATTEISEEKTDTHKYPVYSSQTKNEGLLGYYDKYLFETAITWTTDGANAGTVNYREGKFYSTNVNGVLLSDEGFANKVVAEILNNEAWKYVSKVGNPKLMNNVMSEISLVIPNDFREISILSTFFQDLDKAITKQEEKVNQLKESKQTLLRKMFV